MNRLTTRPDRNGADESAPRLSSKDAARISRMEEKSEGFGKSRRGRDRDDEDDGAVFRSWAMPAADRDRR